MSLVAAIMVPHPPLIVPEVGRGEEAIITKTQKAYNEAAQFIASFEPETVIVSSPHALMYADYFHISPGADASGSLAEFRAPQVRFRVSYDEEFVRSLSDTTEAQNFPAGILGERNPALDHGTMVPLYFLERNYQKPYKLVRVGLSGLSLVDHYRFGQLIRECAEKLNRKVVYIASGDLSHKLKENGPYGFAAEGPEYDKRIMQVMGQADFEKLFEFSESFLEKAAECGHRSFVIMAGALDGLNVEPKELSYQDVTGVGYGVCTFKVKSKNQTRKFLQQREKVRKEKLAKMRSNEDAYISLARATVESFVSAGSVPEIPDGLPSEMYKKRAGVFVSIHEEGQLRGCIGTIAPTCASIAEEIIQNAVSASTRDPRFPAVRDDELERLDYSVDVLSPAEPIRSIAELDPQRYGVIVRCGSRCGLLLPRLDGVDTAEEQVSIARRKGRIDPTEKISLERFEVIRHE